MNRGRKTKLTESVLNKLRATEGKGYLDKTLAQIVNVHPDTFSAWKAKGSTAKAGIFYRFHLLLCDLEAALEVRVIDALMAEVDKGNIRAIELAMRRRPHLRKTFREEPIQAVTELELNEDRNKDVIEERTKKFIADLESRGYYVRPQEAIDKRIEAWLDMVHKLNEDTSSEA